MLLHLIHGNSSLGKVRPNRLEGRMGPLAFPVLQSYWLVDNVGFLA